MTDQEILDCPFSIGNAMLFTHNGRRRHAVKTTTGWRIYGTWDYPPELIPTEDELVAIAEATLQLLGRGTP